VYGEIRCTSVKLLYIYFTVVCWGRPIHSPKLSVKQCSNTARTPEKDLVRKLPKIYGIWYATYGYSTNHFRTVRQCACSDACKNLSNATGTCRSMIPVSYGLPVEFFYLRTGKYGVVCTDLGKNAYRNFEKKKHVLRMDSAIALGVLLITRKSRQTHEWTISFQQLISW
jgi:hypothetical protein